jgi:hypothetical protein
VAACLGPGFISCSILVTFIDYVASIYERLDSGYSKLVASSGVEFQLALLSQYPQ